MPSRCDNCAVLEIQNQKAKLLGGSNEAKFISRIFVCTCTSDTQTRFITISFITTSFITTFCKYKFYDADLTFM